MGDARMILLAIYIIGFFITWVLAARYWVNEFGPGDAWEGGCWGFFVALGWPIAVLCFGIGKIVSLSLGKS